MHRIIISVLLLLPASTAHAVVVGTAVAVMGGSALLDRAADAADESIAKAEAAAHGLLGRADQIAEKRLQQIDEIIAKSIRDITGQTEETVLRILTRTRKDIDELRSRTMADVRQVVWETECAGKRWLNEDIPAALGGLGRFLNVNEFELTPPVYLLDRPSAFERLYRPDPYIIRVKTPFDRTYVEVRDIMEDAISSDVVTDETPAHHVVATWEYLAAFALKTSCFFNGSSDVWNEEFIRYKEEANRWRNLVSIRVQ